MRRLLTGLCLLGLALVGGAPGASAVSIDLSILHFPSELPPRPLYRLVDPVFEDHEVDAAERLRFELTEPLLMALDALGEAIVDVRLRALRLSHGDPVDQTEFMVPLTTELSESTCSVADRVVAVGSPADAELRISLAGTRCFPFLGIEARGGFPVLLAGRLELVPESATVLLLLLGLAALGLVGRRRARRG